MTAAVFTRSLGQNVGSCGIGNQDLVGSLHPLVQVTEGPVATVVAVDSAPAGDTVATVVTVDLHLPETL